MSSNLKKKNYDKLFDYFFYRIVDSAFYIHLVEGFIETKVILGHSWKSQTLEVSWKEDPEFVVEVVFISRTALDSPLLEHYYEHRIL